MPEPLLPLQPPAPTSPPSSLPPVGQLITDTVDVIKKKFVPLIILQAIAVTPVLILLLIGMGENFFATRATDPSLLIGLVGIVGIAVLFLLIASFAISAAQMYLVANAAVTSVGGALKHGLRRLGAMIGYTILLALLILPVFIVFYITALAAGFGNSLGSVGIAVVAVLVLLAFYFYLWLRLGFTLPIAALGEYQGSAVKHSWRLTRGRVGGIVVRALILMIISGAINVAITMIAGLAQLGVGAVIGAGISLVGTSVLQLLGTVYFVIMLRHLEGSDRHRSQI